MGYIILAPSFPNSSVVELKTVNFAVPRSNRGWGVCPISIVVMQQFCKLQRTVQFCYGALDIILIMSYNA